MIKGENRKVRVQGGSGEGGKRDADCGQAINTFLCGGCGCVYVQMWCDADRGTLMIDDNAYCTV